MASDLERLLVKSRSSGSTTSLDQPTMDELPGGIGGPGSCTP